MSGQIRTNLGRDRRVAQRHCEEYIAALTTKPVPWDASTKGKFDGMLAKLQADNKKLEDGWKKWEGVVDRILDEDEHAAELKLYNEWRDDDQYIDIMDNLCGFIAEIQYYLQVPWDPLNEFLPKPDPILSQPAFPKVQQCEPRQPEAETPGLEPTHAKKYLSFPPGFNMEAVFEEDNCGRKNLQVDSSSVAKIDGPASRRRVVLQAARGEDIVSRYFYKALFGRVFVYSCLGNDVIDLGHPNGNGAAVFDPGILQKHYCIRETQSVDGANEEGAVNLDISA